MRSESRTQPADAHGVTRTASALIPRRIEPGRPLVATKLPELVPLPDLLIAQCAIGGGRVIWHADEDFRAYPPAQLLADKALAGYEVRSTASMTRVNGMRAASLTSFTTAASGASNKHIQRDS